MGKIIIENAIKREKGKLYYINKDGDICESILKRGGKKSEKECKQCGRRFLGQRTKFCSNECSYKFSLTKPKKLRGYKAGLFKGECEICNKEFIKSNSRHRICSDECRKMKSDSIKNFTFFERFNEDEGNKSLRLLKLRFEVLKRDDFTCQYCGRNVNQDKVKLHIDHIIPKSKGGEDTISNLRTSCSACNLGKSDILLNYRILEKENGKLNT